MAKKKIADLLPKITSIQSLVNEKLGTNIQLPGNADAAIKNVVEEKVQPLVNKTETEIGQSIADVWARGGSDTTFADEVVEAPPAKEKGINYFDTWIYAGAAAAVILIIVIIIILSRR